ncbi:30160_t:CDS:1, partial [Racocetra persica]
RRKSHKNKRKTKPIPYMDDPTTQRNDETYEHENKRIVSKEKKKPQEQKKKTKPILIWMTQRRNAMRNLRT